MFMIERRKLLLLTASLGISIITLLFILFFTPYKITPETLDALVRINPVFLSLAILTHLGAFVIWSIRLKLLSNFIINRESELRGKELKLLKSVKTILASLFAACITPSQFGGEPARIYLLKKHGFSVGAATAVVFGERVLDFTVIMVGAAASFLLFRAVLPQHSIIYSIFTGIGACFVVGIVLMAFCLAKPEKASKVVDFVFLKIKLRRLRNQEAKFYQELSNFFSAIKRFQSEGRSTLGLALIITVAFWLVAFTVPSILLLGFGANPNWIYSIAAQFVLLIIVAIPVTPGSSGVAELSLTYLYHSMVGVSILGIFAVVWRLSTYYVDLIVGGITSVKVISEMP